MSVRSFRPVIAVASVAAAALGCYLVSLRVATERANLEDVETRIVLAQRDIRTLQTEIGTRGRLEQLERWNASVLALSAPKADQFVEGGYQLARLARPSDQINLAAPVVLASAPRPQPARPMVDDDADVAATSTTSAQPEPRNDGAASIMHVASYSVAAKPRVDAAVPAPKAAAPTPKVARTAPDAKAAPVGRAAPHREPAHGVTARDTGTHQ